SAAARHGRVPVFLCAALVRAWREGWPERATGHAVHHAPPLPIIVITLIVLLVVAAGVALAWLAYGRQQPAAEAPADSEVSFFTRAGRAELYGNAINDALVVRPVTHLTRALVWGDGKIIDGLVTGSATSE